MVVYTPPPGYEFMKQDDKVSPLVWATIFSPINLGMGISRFGDLEDGWPYTIDSDFIVHSVWIAIGVRSWFS
jgi:hypothetical protein